jgi:hypothetical protein
MEPLDVVDRHALMITARTDASSPAPMLPRTYPGTEDADRIVHFGPSSSSISRTRGRLISHRGSQGGSVATGKSPIETKM